MGQEVVFGWGGAWKTCAPSHQAGNFVRWAARFGRASQRSWALGGPSTMSLNINILDMYYIFDVDHEHSDTDSYWQTAKAILWGCRRPFTCHWFRSELQPHCCSHESLSFFISVVFFLICPLNEFFSGTISWSRFWHTLCQLFLIFFSTKSPTDLLLLLIPSTWETSPAPERFRFEQLSKKPGWLYAISHSLSPKKIPGTKQKPPDNHIHPYSMLIEYRVMTKYMP